MIRHGTPETRRVAPFVLALLVAGCSAPAGSEPLARVDLARAAPAAAVPRQEGLDRLLSRQLSASGASASGAAQPRPADWVQVVPYESVDRARVVITFTGPASFALEPAGGSAPAVALRIAGARAPSAVPAQRFSGGLLRSLEVEEEEGDARAELRLVLGLSSAATANAFSIADPFRIVVDLRADEKAPAETGVRRTVARVALDPGHGGADAGAIGRAGLREKDVVLDVAHRAASVLSRELGIATLMTRDDDTFVPLKERTEKANAFHADLFVSIHCDASPELGARGASTYVLDRTRDRRAERTAARENGAADPRDADLSEWLAHLRSSGLGERAEEFGGLLQQAVRASAKEPGRAGSPARSANRGVRRAALYVLEGAEMPGVLFETSFISEPSEERLLASAPFRQALADSIVNAVRAYRDGR